MEYWCWNSQNHSGLFFILHFAPPPQKQKSVSPIQIKFGWGQFGIRISFLAFCIRRFSTHHTLLCIRRALLFAKMVSLFSWLSKGTQKVEIDLSVLFPNEEQKCISKLILQSTELVSLFSTWNGSNTMWFFLRSVLQDVRIRLSLSCPDASQCWCKYQFQWERRKKEETECKLNDTGQGDNHYIKVFWGLPFSLQAPFKQLLSGRSLKEMKAAKLISDKIWAVLICDKK